MKGFKKTKKRIKTNSTKKTKRKISDIKYPKVLINDSCDAYMIQGNQIKYIRNGVEYCRTVHGKEHTQNDKRQDDDIYKMCNSFTVSEKEFLSKLFFIDEEELCGTLKKWTLMYELNKQEASHVMSKLKIKLSSRKMKKKEICDSIYKKINENLIGSFREISLNSKVKNKSEWLVYLLYKILIPNGFTAHTELSISDDMYNEYLLLLQREDDQTIKGLFTDEKSRKFQFQYLTRTELSLLRDALEAKFCSCISKFVFQNRLLQIMKSGSTKLMKYNPVDICKSSILLNRKTNPARKTKFILPFDPEIINSCHKRVVSELNL